MLPKTESDLGFDQWRADRERLATTTMPIATFNSEWRPFVVGRYVAPNLRPLFPRRAVGTPATFCRALGGRRLAAATDGRHSVSEAA